MQYEFCRYASFKSFEEESFKRHIAVCAKVIRESSDI